MCAACCEKFSSRTQIASVDEDEFVSFLNGQLQVLCWHQIILAFVIWVPLPEREVPLLFALARLGQGSHRVVNLLCSVTCASACVPDLSTVSTDENQAQS